MATRPKFKPYIVLPNAYSSPANSGSMAVNLTSQATVVSNLSMVSYEAVWTGSSPVGAVSVQGSNDYLLGAEGNILNAGTWTTLPLSYNGNSVMSIPVTGNSGNGVIDIASTGLYALRFVYTATSGTGSLVVTIAAKVA